MSEPLVVLVCDECERDIRVCECLDVEESHPNYTPHFKSGSSTKEARE